MEQSAFRPVTETTGALLLAQGNAQFALDLYRRLCLAEGNLFFSPYSISTALGMTYAGARGETSEQIKQTLHFHLAKDNLHQAFAMLQAKLLDIEKQSGVQLKIANALWPDVAYPLLREYLDMVWRYYGVLITAVNYRLTEHARLTINAWVEEKTQQKIQDLIPKGILDELTALVLTNAIYFKGNWASQFNKQRTTEEPFWAASEASIPVMMMHQEGEYSYLEVPGIQILEMPYVGEALSMLILLPTEVDGLMRLEQSLNADNLMRWTTKLSYSQRMIQISIPRFELTGEFDLSKVLGVMGMPNAFSRAADFSGMDGTVSLYIAYVLHTAYIAVNEEGTEAAAATAVIFKRSLPPPPVIFHADHPFIFIIRERISGSILFMGRVVNPGLIQEKPDKTLDEN